jgi:hypothetical protein
MRLYALIYYKHIYRFCTKYWLQVNIYKLWPWGETMRWRPINLIQTKAAYKKSGYKNPNVTYCYVTHTHPHTHTHTNTHTHTQTHTSCLVGIFWNLRFYITDNEIIWTISYHHICYVGEHKMRNSCTEGIELNVVCFLPGNSPASEFCMPTFRNTLSVPSS